jgi:DNA-directed RNA polymerase
MRKFTGLEYLYIDIANQFGLDKESWDTRIKWTKDHMDDLESLTDDADDKPLYIKGVAALRDTQAGIPTGFIMGLDATASGLQIMAALTGCTKSAKCVNLIDTGRREDVYDIIPKQMQKYTSTKVTRKHAKPAIMTTYYGSKATPRAIFGEHSEELAAFYKALNKRTPGPLQLMKDIQALWEPGTYSYSWTLPDKHVVVADIYDAVDKRIEIDELDHASFTHRMYKNVATEYDVSLAANIVHSIDGYIVREMYRRTAKMGIQMTAIHDSFWAHPNDMNHIRWFYIQIMAEIAKSNLMSKIFSEIEERKIKYEKRSKKLAKKILKSEYALS